jgi:hypothetical protein
LKYTKGRTNDSTAYIWLSQVAFTDHDTNKNGTIELDELAALLRALDLTRFIAVLPAAPAAPANGGAAADGGAARARSHCPCVLPLIHFTPYSVPLFLKRECDLTLGAAAAADEESVWSQRYDFRELLAAVHLLSTGALTALTPSALEN